MNLTSSKIMNSSLKAITIQPHKKDKLDQFNNFNKNKSFQIITIKLF